MDTSEVQLNPWFKNSLIDITPRPVHKSGTRKTVTGMESSAAALCRAQPVASLPQSQKMRC
jgi:hypothetical protein